MNISSKTLVRSSYLMTIIGFVSLNWLPPVTTVFAFCVLALPLFMTLVKPRQYTAGDPGWMSDATSLEDLMKFNSFAVLGYVAKFSLSGTLLLWGLAILSTIAIAFILRLFFIPVRRHKAQYIISICALVIFALYSVGDYSVRFSSDYETAIVKEKRNFSTPVNGAPIIHYYIDVLAEDPFSEIGEVKVNSDQYEELYEGQIICLKVFNSWLYQSWVRVHATKACPGYHAASKPETKNVAEALLRQ